MSEMSEGLLGLDGVGAGWTPLDVRIELSEGEWAAEGELLDGTIEAIGVLPEGTNRGKPAVGLLIRLSDGRAVGAWTTYNLFATAALAFRARYGDPSG